MRVHFIYLTSVHINIEAFVIEIYNLSNTKKKKQMFEIVVRSSMAATKVWRTSISLVYISWLSLYYGFFNAYIKLNLHFGHAHDRLLYFRVWLIPYGFSALWTLFLFSKTYCFTHLRITYFLITITAHKKYFSFQWTKACKIFVNQKQLAFEKKNISAILRN